jgi:hypothetical protein
MYTNCMLRSVFLQVPTIPNPVVVLEFQAWYRKVKENSGFSLCAALSQDFLCFNL